MKKYLGLTIITGVLLLLSGTPCFADSGAGVAIQLTTTVTGGSSGNGWSGGGYTNWQYVDNQPRKVSPFVPAVTNSPLPTPPTYSDTEPDTVPAVTNLPISEPSNAINWGFILAIAVLAGAIGLLIYLVIRMRRKLGTKEVGQT